MRFSKNTIPVSSFLLSLVAAQRSFILENKCSYPIQVTGVSGAVGKCANGCISGSSCGADGINCYYNIPAASNGYLLQSGAQSTVTFPANGQSIVWSGNFDACNANNKEQCNRVNGNPTTKAEFTVVNGGTDFYDVETINGHSVPVAIYPQTTKTSSDPYFCGSPGAPNPQTATGSCSWNFSPPNVYYNWVSAGGNACSSQSDCSGGNTCGLSNNVGQAQRFRLTCGQLLGYWTANQICGIQRDFGYPFNCNQQLSNQNSGRTNYNLMACDNGISSCYTDGASNNCCGCANWNTLGIQVPGNSENCKSSNPDWTNNVLPGLQFFKKACPTAYTYPYDDKSSTFTCNANNVVYKVTWCPSGASPPPNPTCKLVANTDYQGQDIANVARSSADQCCDACSSTAGCVVAVWTNHNGGTCWLKNGAANQIYNPLAQATVPNNNKQCSLNANTDYQGQDIKNVAKSSADQCCDACSNTPGCVVAVWTDYQGGTCWLKNGIANRVYKQGAQATVPSNNNQCFLNANTDYQGQDIKNVAKSSADQCCDACSSTAGCVVAVWTDYQGGTCWLKSGTANRIYKLGAQATIGAGPNPPPPPPSDVTYCPASSDLITAYTNNNGNQPTIYNGGWTLSNGGGVATKAAFNLLGGSVEYDIDLSNVKVGVNANIYTIGPSNLPASGFSQSSYCDGAKTGSNWCVENDWIESNGNCGGATTLHTVEGSGSGCNAGGCATTYTYNSRPSFHMTITYGSDGGFTVMRDGARVIPGGISSSDLNILKSSMISHGSVIYSSLWTGWVPSAGSCSTVEGSLPSSSFSIKNLQIKGKVVQGPTPHVCTGASAPTGSTSLNCIGIGPFASTPNIGSWCSSNCFMGNCPSTVCSCIDQSSGFQVGGTNGTYTGDDFPMNGASSLSLFTLGLGIVFATLLQILVL